MKDNVKEVNWIFKEGIMSLKENSAPLWLMTLKYHTLTSDNGVIEMIYKDAVKQPKEISDIFKPEYIQWLAVCKGLAAARKAYNSLAVEKPYCKELHATMYKLEALDMDPKIEEMETTLKLACDQFGSEDCDVFIRYIEFCLQYRKQFENTNLNFDVGEKILEIYRQAENLLSQNSLLWSEFTAKYDELKSSLDV